MGEHLKLPCRTQIKLLENLMVWKKAAYWGGELERKKCVGLLGLKCPQRRIPLGPQGDVRPTTTTAPNSLSASNMQRGY